MFPQQSRSKAQADLREVLAYLESIEDQVTCAEARVTETKSLHDTLADARSPIG